MCGTSFNSPDVVVTSHNPGRILCSAACAPVASMKEAARRERRVLRIGSPEAMYSVFRKYFFREVQEIGCST
jgi:hypothetical protein